MERLKDKKIIITGGAGSIGKTFAKKATAEGATVFLVDIDEDGLKKAVEEIGDHAHYHVARVNDAKEVAGYAQAAMDKMGAVNGFFNNAGIEGEVHPMTDYPEEEFDKVMDVNLKGVFLGAKYVMPKMAESGGGSMVMTSSVAGLGGTPGMTAYTTSKHGIIGLMRTAALEGAEQGIRTNTVHPGPVDNRMMRSLEDGMNPGGGEEVKQGFEQQIPWKRYAKPEDIAHLVTFLLSDESEYCNGSTFVADGGFQAST